MWLRAMACAAVLLLAGCGGAPQQGNVQTTLHREQDIKQALERCRDAWPVALSKGRARCQNDEQRTILLKYGEPSMDLYDLLFAYRMAVAERHENGQVTEAEGLRQVAELGQRIRTEQQRRRIARDQMLHQAMQAAKARAAAYTKLLHGLGAWSAATKAQVAAGLAPAEITCYSEAATVECR